MRLRRGSYFPVLLITAFALLGGGCATNQQQILATSQSQVALRNIQSRAFDTTDKKLMLRSVINTMQDLDFLIQDSSLELGTVTGQKYSGMVVVKMSVMVRERNAKQLLVRANVEYGIKAVDDAKTYQDFFAALEKSVFLTAQQVD